MIHTIYSNSYEVLRAVLLHNIDALRLRPEADELSPEALFAGAFDRVPVIVPSKAVAMDLKRAIASEEEICAGMEFMHLSRWLGLFSKPLASVIGDETGHGREEVATVVGNEVDWMIWSILRQTGPGSFREQVAKMTPRLEDCLRGRSDLEIFVLAQRIAAVFVSYASYRLDWVFDWLGMHQEGLSPGPDVLTERARMEKDEDVWWQRLLWQRLADMENWHGREFLEKLPGTLGQLKGVPPEVREMDFGLGRVVPLPNALHIFMPFVVPPLMLPVVKAYAHSGRDVWLYLLNPCSEYWFDLVPRRLFNWRKGAGDHREVGHPVLADNGRSTRANIDRLWRFTAADDDLGGTIPKAADEPPEYLGDPKEINVLRSRDVLRDFLEHPRDITVDMEVDAQSIYLEANDPRLLRRVQDSILKLDPEVLSASGEVVAEGDGSLLFVRAATPVRELEGLADWLQARFREDPSLEPDDVLVVTPDISLMSPLIDQVFGSLPDGRRIAYRVSGALTSAEDEPLEALKGLVSLLKGRLKREQLLAWLSLPLVSRRFRLESEDLETLSAWLASAGFEFGLTDAHLLAVDPVTFAQVRESTLTRAIERLMLGAAFPGGIRQPFLGVLPREGTEAAGWTPVSDRPDLLATLSTICAGLETLRLATLTKAEGGTADEEPGRWEDWVALALETFFPCETPSENWQSLREGVEKLVTQIAAAADTADREEAMRSVASVPFDLFFSALDTKLRRSAVIGIPGNRVTFTDMSQLRGLPYRIIAVVGLNEDSSFPGSSHAEEFDLMSRFPRRGDRDSRQDNRNVFLDLLLAARDRFLISWSGGTNPTQPKEPSIIAQELRDWILSFAKDSAERRLWLGRLLVKLPLTGFSAGAFKPEAGDWRSTDPVLLEAFRDASASGWAAKERPFTEGAAAPAVKPGMRVPLKELLAAWGDPAKHMLRGHGISLGLGAGDELEAAPFYPDQAGLARWSRITELLEAFNRGEPAQTVKARWAADPAIGAAGVREWALDGIEELACGICSEAVNARTGLARLDPVRIEIPVPECGIVITHETHDLWAAPAEPGDVRFLRMSASKPTSRGGEAALLEFAALFAAGVAKSGTFVGLSKDNVPVRMLMPKFRKADDALLLLRLVAAGWVLVKRSEPRFAKPPVTNVPETPENRTAFRGGDLKGAQSFRETVSDRITSLYEPAVAKPAKKKSAKAAPPPDPYAAAMNELQSVADEILQSIKVNP
ncbi:exodeoxyribonuclease V subunit gamma [Sutterella sp.]|uniref:exodeoxyribonuclease V subunit gamma n=1 Tax=Sutterella sp. TaxID=1981025 RepID=UPI0026E078AD|nr:exodeoxyribonuclease V subunit gamma [Sutterella sp.]MDO5531612.1 exodeoxyribonuclease V subunit gamma [Sutterella sp.]